MKEVKLSGISKFGKSYRVSLGNGHQETFTNLKLAKQYLAETGRWLTFKLHECSSITVQLYGHYRANWFYMHHNKATMNHALVATDLQCSRAFETIHSAMDMIIDRAGFINGNQFVFTHFLAIFRNQGTIIADLQLLNRRKSNGVDVHELQVIWNKVKAMQLEVESYRRPPDELPAYDEHPSIVFPLQIVK